jgi:hypothetical protein
MAKEPEDKSMESWIWDAAGSEIYNRFGAWS